MINRIGSSLARLNPGSDRSYTSKLLAALRLGARSDDNKGRRAPSQNGGKDNQIELVVTKEEQEGMDARERAMLRAIVRLDEATAREVMVPRVDIVAVDIDATLAEVAQQMAERGHSRLPVYNDNLDHIMGVVHARDILQILAHAADRRTIKDIIRPAYFIPEFKLLDDLLEDLQEKHIQMAIVVDEYGGTEGLVTVEDVLEEIVGEIEDEFSALKHDPQVVRVADGELLVDATVTLEQLGELLEVPIVAPEFDTIGAYVYGALGRIPEAGDEVALNSLQVRVVSLLGRRIRKLSIIRTT